MLLHRGMMVDVYNRLLNLDAPCGASLFGSKRVLF